MGTPNWARLVSQNRAKDIGVPWNEKESAALAAGVSPDLVRRGALTPKDAEKFAKADAAAVEETGNLPVDAMDRAHLATRARELGLEFSPETPTVNLRKLVSDAEGKDETESEGDTTESETEETESGDTAESETEETESGDTAESETEETEPVVRKRSPKKRVASNK